MVKPIQYFIMFTVNILFLLFVSDLPSTLKHLQWTFYRKRVAQTVLFEWIEMWCAKMVHVTVWHMDHFRYYKLIQ